MKHFNFICLLIIIFLFAFNIALAQLEGNSLNIPQIGLTWNCGKLNTFLINSPISSPFYVAASGIHSDISDSNGNLLFHYFDLCATFFD